MIYDALDILLPRARFTAEGKFWTERPDSADEGGMAFNYEYVEPSSRSYRRLFGTMQTFDADEIAIRSNDILPWDAEKYFMTADGALYRVLQALKDYTDAPKQAMRLLGTPIGTQYVIRGVRIDNPWGAK